MHLRTAIALTALLVCGTIASRTLAWDEAGARHTETPLTATSPTQPGGLSGIEVIDGGKRFIAISDRGALAEGHFRRKDGRLIAAVVDKMRPLPQAAHRPDPWRAVDSEGIALMPDGRIAVSLEGRDGFWILETDGTVTRIKTTPREIPLPPNRRYEALAVDQDGRLYTLPEISASSDTPFPLWRYENDDWHKVALIPRKNGYLPVGADFGPDGSLYILERCFMFGFRNRIMRYDLSEPGSRGDLVWQGGWDNVNYEGLSVWATEDEGTTMTLISDDNFMAILRQSVLEIPLASKATKG